MRTVVTVAVMLALLGVVALCPAFACFAPASAHPCCPHHKAPVAARDCPSMVLETGKASPVLSAAVESPEIAHVPLPIEAAFLPAAAPAAVSQELILLLRTLRI
jgi:hypothetical protein